MYMFKWLSYNIAVKIHKKVETFKLRPSSLGRVKQSGCEACMMWNLIVTEHLQMSARFIRGLLFCYQKINVHIMQER